jgi:amino acid transporter
MSDPIVSRPPGANDGGTLSAGSEEGLLSRPQVVSLSVASFGPAVGMALVPMLMFTYAGTTSWQPLLLATIVTICIGLAIITFARRFVATGSLYSYIGEVFGPWARYITAAALFLGYAIQVASLAGVIGIFIGSFMTSLGVGNSLQSGIQTAIYVVAIGVAAFVTARGLDTSVRTAVGLAILSTPLMLVITVASGLHTGLHLAQQFSFHDFTVGGVSQGVAAGATFLIGFESCAALATETRDPKRNVPLAIMAVPVVLGALYVASTVVQLPGLAEASAQLNAGVSPPAALALQAGLGQPVATATDLVLAVATFAGLIGFLNFGSRFVTTLAVDRLLPARLSAVHRRHHSPVIAIGVLAVLGFALMTAMVLRAGDVVAGYTALATLIVFAWVPPYLLIAAGAIKLVVRSRRFRPGPVAAFLLGAAGMAWTFVNGIIYPLPPPYDAMNWIAFVSIAVIVLFFVLFKRRHPQSTTPGAPEA